MKEPVSQQSEEILSEVKGRAMEFALDNFGTPTPEIILLIETAMTIGVTIGMRNDLTFQRQPVI